MEIDCGCCRVRSWQCEDAESIVRHANNRNVWRHLRDRFPHPYTAEEAQKWLIYAASSDPEVDFAIEFGDQAVGGIGFTLGAGEEKHSAEVGYWLGESVWRMGIATAALVGAVQFATATFDLWRISAIPFSDNIASIKVLEKAGFVKEGVMRCSAIKEGKIKDQFLYAYLVESCRDRR